MGLYEDFQQGTGMFGITAMSGERKLARAVAPALAGIMSQQVRANADVTGAEIGARASTDVASIRDLGETFRQKLLNQANINITEMQQAGANWRTKYGEDASTGRTSRTLNTQWNIDKEGRTLKEKLADLDRGMLEKYYDRFGTRADASKVLALEDRPTSTLDDIAVPGAIRRRRDRDEEMIRPYDFSAIFPGGS